MIAGLRPARTAVRSAGVPSARDAKAEPVSSLTEIVRPAFDDPVVCVVRGEVDISNVAELRAGLDAAFAESPSVVVDLSGVRFLASAGVRSLVEAGVNAAGRRMVIVTGPGVSTILRICGIASLVPCVPDRAAAERVWRG